MTSAFQATDRTVLKITGGDRTRFLQDLVTNDISHLPTAPVYAALLTPQGKYLADFFLVEAGDDSILMDCASDQADALEQRLQLYKLRADVGIERTNILVYQGLDDKPDGAWADPRTAALGWRLLSDEARSFDALNPADWDALRIREGVPEAGRDLMPNDSYILEMGFGRLNGVDFRKGCYVGQEVTARMRHKTELRKGLARVRLDGQAEPGTEILAGSKPAGRLTSVSGAEGLAYLRYDRATGDLRAGAATVTVLDR